MNMCYVFICSHAISCVCVCTLTGKSIDSSSLKAQSSTSSQPDSCQGCSPAVLCKSAWPVCQKSLTPTCCALVGALLTIHASLTRPCMLKLTFTTVVLKLWCATPVVSLWLPWVENREIHIIFMYIDKYTHCIYSSIYLYMYIQIYVYVFI